jgi:hypothetical protein
VWSTFESRHNAAEPEPYIRGINSVQLLKDGDRWWVVNVFWDFEGSRRVPARRSDAPRRSSSPKAAQEGVIEPEPPMPTKILLVEDEQLLRESLAQLLTEEGYQVVQAGDGKAGYDAARRAL